MAQRSYYDILGLDRTASQDEVKRAFRRLAHKHHPDVNPDDPKAEARFKEIAEAYSVLSDPDKRAQYDMYGSAGPGVPMGGEAWDTFGGFADIFEAFFGGAAAPRGRPVRRGSDLRYDTEVTLEEVLTGTERTFPVERLRPCNTCQGTGSRSASAQRPCASCQGTGQVRQSRATPFGRITTVTTCPTCEGEGTVVSDPCPDCRGSGRRRSQEELTAEIPAGIDDGGMVRLAGEGEAGERGAPAGDLYVVVHLKPHRIFARRGRDISCEAPLPFTLAALGGTLPVPTLEGEDSLEVPAGTQTGTRFTLHGRGLPDVRTGVRGAEHVTVRVTVPTRLNDRQRELLTEFEKEGGEEYEHPKSWFQRLREALRGEEEEQ